MTVEGKVMTSFAEAVADVVDGSTLIVGGFGLSGCPEHAIAALRESGVRDLTVVSNNCGVDDFGLGILLANQQIRKMVASYVGENKRFESQYLSGALEVEFCPQGTLAERMRAGGSGIPAFYTPTGVGTPIADGKEVREFAGRQCLLETAITGDFALVKAWKGDPLGNLIYRKTARNFNPLAAMAGRVTIAEVEELVEVGELDPDQIHTPGIFVQRILPGAGYEKRIERLVESRAGEPHAAVTDPSPRDVIIARAAREIHDGMNVNLGIGLPTLLADHASDHQQVLLQSENGLLGIGPYPAPGTADPDLINAGKETVTVVPGASYFDSAESFAMIRGGHVDLAILGGMEVSESGDLANWMIPQKLVKGMGGAMDLVQGAKRVVVVMEHRTRSGQSRIKRVCTLPLTGVGVVNTLITDLAVFQIDPARGLLLTELQPGVSLDEVSASTEAQFTVALGRD